MASDLSPADLQHNNGYWCNHTGDYRRQQRLLRLQITDWSALPID